MVLDDEKGGRKALMVPDMKDSGRPTRILILNGSPHRAASTTMLATNALVQGMMACGKYEAETIHISDLRITPCTGCLSCWGRTEGECVIRNDDIPWVKQKIEASDLLIGSFPLYFFGMPGQMKVMMDRLLSMVGAYHGQLTPRDSSPAHAFRSPVASRKFLVVSGCAYTETDVVYDPICRQLDLVCGKGNYTAVLCPQFKTMIDNGGARKERILSRFVRAGEEYARTGTLSPETIRAITKPLFSPEVYSTILENVWEKERERGKKANDSAGR